MQKFLFLIFAILLIGFAVHMAGGTLAASSGIPAEAVSRLLFHVNDNLKQEILALGSDKITEFRIPVFLGVSPDEIQDTWGDARTHGRVHEGTDIMAPRGELIVSPTKAVVTNIGHDRLGGNYVITAVSGGEQFYYAHLAGAADNLKPGMILAPGDLIGFVGNTGDARGRATHLHLGIYYERRATNPYPRLTQEFSLSERIAAIDKILSTYDTAPLLALHLLERHRDLFSEARAEKLILPPMIAALMDHAEIVATAHLLDNGIAPGAANPGVRTLQNFLVDAASGPAALALAGKGITGRFGTLTERALAEFQSVSHITPARGYFGTLTQSKIVAALVEKALAAEQTPSQLSRTGKPPLQEP